jgi:LPS-assembly protein
MYMDPYSIQGRKLDKISENYMTVDEGYLTTCDLDEPHFRFGAHRMDIYQHDRAVAHGVKIYLGKVPVMYIPYYVQDLKNRPIVTFIPGDKKDFGIFLLSTTRLQIGSHIKVNIHADVRERRGFGEGFDAKYDTPGFGAGLLSAYYTDEQFIPVHHYWRLWKNGVKIAKGIHHERYRLIWRHKWQVDPNTNVVLQYYKIHDYDIVNNGFLKTYFPKEFQQNGQTANVGTYFLLTHNMPHGTLTFDVETSRENRPIRGLERIPEVKYIVNTQQIGRTGFYVKSTNTFSDLTQQNYPKTHTLKTIRFDSNDDISHPFKVGFISFNPHLGGEETYYTRTALIDRNNIIRGMLRTGLDMTTKFYKVWDYHTDFMGMDINRLRHVITPSISYTLQGRPTFPSGYLNQFDPIDNLSRSSALGFSLVNELQTKRNGQIVNLIRFLVTSTYQLKVKGLRGHRGFGPYDAILDINPTDWLRFHSETIYDSFANTLKSFDSYAAMTGKYGSISLGNNYGAGAGDQLTGEIDFRLNPKWWFRVWGSFPVMKAAGGGTSGARQYEYEIVRDLHEWEMDVVINQTQGQGSSLYILFRLKAMPDQKLNFLNTLFHSDKPAPPPQKSTTGATGATGAVQ